MDISDQLRQIRDEITNAPATPPEEPTETPVPADTEAPVSTVEVLPNSVPEDFSVTWYGFDNGGSGIASYDVFVSTDGGEFVLWQNDTTALSGIYDGESDRSYQFYSVATDNAGNSESTIQVQTSTATNGNTQQPAIYRLFNSSTGVHLYTANPAERDSVIQNLSNYQYEGVSYFAARSDEGIPVYRVYNPVVDGHFYTTDAAERDTIIQSDPNYVLEGEAFTAFTQQVEGTVPVYRFFISESGAYFYTSNEAERESILANLPNYEFQQVAFYSFPLDADFTPLPPAPEPDNSNFLGSNIFFQVYGPDIETPITSGLTANVRDGVEFSNLIDNDLEGGVGSINASIDITANSVLVEVDQDAGTLENDEFNGYIFLDSDDSLPPIESITIDRSASTLGIEDEDIFSIENSFAINLAGTEYTRGDTLKLDINFGSEAATPPEQPEVNDGSNFTGAEIQYQTFFPDTATSAGDPLTATAGNGVEFVIPTTDDGIGESLDISGNSIIYEVNDPNSTFANVEFNGFVVSDVSDNLPAITNVTIDPAGTTLGVDNSDIQFTEDSIAVNVASLPYTIGDTIKLDVEFADI